MTLEMPPLYRALTTEAERVRHAALMPASGQLRVHAEQLASGHWQLELLTTDWDDPGLLRSIFDVLLRSVDVPGGVAQRSTRIFTGRSGQVINLLRLEQRDGRPLEAGQVGELKQRLLAVQAGEPSDLLALGQLSFPSLIPMPAGFPALEDDPQAPQTTCVTLRAERLSNRFVSLLLHGLGTGGLWWNTRQAIFEQGAQGARYSLYVVNARGGKLHDSPALRRALLSALEDMSERIVHFNRDEVEQRWRERVENNAFTIYHSRPNVEDLLADLVDLRTLAEVHGKAHRLSSLVEMGVLESRAFYLLKQAESFMETHAATFAQMRQEPPTAAQIELARAYFALRQQTLTVIQPAFHRLLHDVTHHGRLSPEERLEVMLRGPAEQESFGLNQRFELDLGGRNVWIEEPYQVLDVFKLMARCDSSLSPRLEAAVSAALEGWSARYQEQHRARLGPRFLALLEEGIAARNTASVLRQMRNIGLLRRYLPQFGHIEGLIHVVADHQYTVDEHTFLVIEALDSLSLLASIFAPQAGPSAEDDVVPEGISLCDLQQEYERVGSVPQFKRFAQKYEWDFRVWPRIPDLRGHPYVKLFLRLMRQVSRDPLELLIDIQILERGDTVCRSALAEVQAVVSRVWPLVEAHEALAASQKRLLRLAGLFHDFYKPAVEHPRQMAEALDVHLAEGGLVLPPAEVETLRWLIATHVDLQRLLQGAEPREALRRYAERVGSLERVRLLILFTYADRVAVRSGANKSSHDALVLAQALAHLEASC